MTKKRATTSLYWLTGVFIRKHSEVGKQRKSSAAVRWISASLLLFKFWAFFCLVNMFQNSLKETIQLGQLDRPSWRTSLKNRVPHPGHLLDHQVPSWPACSWLPLAIRKKEQPSRGFAVKGPWMFRYSATWSPKHFKARCCFQTTWIKITMSTPTKHVEITWSS